MKLFLISQEQNDDIDAHRSAVVAAPDEDTARHMDPDLGKRIENWELLCLGWCNSPDYVVVKYIGEAAPDIEQGALCAD